MAYYRLTISNDPASDVTQLVVHWDPSTVITQTNVATGDLTPAELTRQLDGLGFQLVSTDSDNLARGWVIVQRLGEHKWFNPADRSWSTTKPANPTMAEP